MKILILGSKGQLGIELKNSDNNKISNISAKSFTGSLGRQLGTTGGAGGTVTGLYIFDSKNNRIVDNIFEEIEGGTGGTRTTDTGSGNTGGPGGFATGIYLRNSEFNYLKLNLI